MGLNPLKVWSREECNIGPTTYVILDAEGLNREAHWKKHLQKHEAEILREWAAYDKESQDKCM